MKVKTLIEKLEKCNQDAIVRLGGKNGAEVLFCMEEDSENSPVWLETALDNDMVNEISTRFDSALIYGIDEVDVYNDMLKLGINVDVVRKYMGDDEADHMEQYCEEHGLF